MTSPAGLVPAATPGSAINRKPTHNKPLRCAASPLLCALLSHERPAKVTLRRINSIFNGIMSSANLFTPMLDEVTISISKILWPFKIAITFYYTHVPRILLSSHLAVSHHECNFPHCIFGKMNFRHEQSYTSLCTFTILAPFFVPKSKTVSIQA